MRLEDLRVDLRPRAPSEAVDLGFELLRRHAAGVWAAWGLGWGALLLLSAPLALLPDGAFWAPFVLWWMRPLPERLVVAILARGTFGQEASAAEAFRALRRDGLGGLGRFLTWGRALAVGRCLRQPVWQLEGGAPEVSSRRAAQLAVGGTGRSAAAWGIACIHFETALTFGLLGLAGLFAGDPGVANPFALVMTLAGGEEPGARAGIAYWLSYGIAAGLVGPFYAAGGFSLYLARRSELEAWDIEIALRRLMRRVRPNGGTFLAAVLVLAAFVPAPVRAASCPDSLLGRAQEVERAATTDAARLAVRRSVDSIFQAGDLRTWECRTTWTPIHPKAADEDEPASIPGFLLAWARMLGAAAGVLKWIAIAAFFGFIAYLFWRYRGALRPGDPPAEPSLSASADGYAPDTGPGLPADLEFASRALWAAGDRRSALSLLYRGTVDRLDRGGRLPLARGTTEGALLRRLAGCDGPFETAAREIVLAWASGAWAGRWPDDAGFDRLASRWRRDVEVGR